MEDLIKDNKKGKNEEKKSIQMKEIKPINIDIYIISCFNNYIWDKEGYNKLKSNNPAIKSIKITHKTTYKNDSNYYVIIHKINLAEKLKKIDLYLTSDLSENVLNLKEISFNPDKEFILFSNIEIKPDDLSFISENNKGKNFAKVLTDDEKFKLFYEYLNNQQNFAGIQKLKTNLGIQYFYIIEKKPQIFFSDIIKIFCLAFGQNIITIILDKYKNFDIEYDDIKNKNFDDILNIYNENRNLFFDKNKKYFEKKGNIDTYKKELENFIIIYKLFNKQYEGITNAQLKNVRKVLIKLINNKKDLFKKLYFILFIFDSLVHVMTSEIEIIKIEIDESINLNYEDFEFIYLDIFKGEEESDKYFLDFSEIFIKLVETNEDTEALMNIKKLYKKELKKIPNKNYEDKIIEKIHKSGINRIKQGNFNNEFLIRFLKYDCSIKYQNFELLKYFKIELMDDNFFEQFTKNKIYHFFKINFREYINQFSTNIKDIKYFGIFFKILPPEYHTNDTISTIFNWLKKNINTFDFSKCKSFKEELFIFFKIMINNKLNNFIIDLIKFIKVHIKAYFIDICVSILNQKLISLALETIKEIISSLLFSYENLDNDLNFENIHTILQKVEMNKRNTKIFFSKLENFSLKYDDFFEEKNIRFHLFEILLNSTKINLQDENVLNSSYWQNTNDTCKAIKMSFENLNICLNKIMISLKIIGKGNMSERLKYINKFLNSQYNDYNFNNVSGIVESWEKKLKNIEIMKKYNSFIFQEKESNNNKLIEYSKKIINCNLDYLNSDESFKEYLKYIDDKSFQLAEEILKLRDSQLFLKIFNKIKNKEKKNKNISNRAKDEFYKLKKIFAESEQKIVKELNLNSDALKFLIDITSKSENLLIQEIEWLINYFKINYFSHKEFLIEKIKIYKKSQSIYKILSGILKFYEIFRDIFDSTNENIFPIEQQIINFINLYQSKELITVEQSEKYIKYLNEQFNISKYNVEIFNKFFNAVFTNPNCIKFLKNKKTKDVEYSKEFLLDNQESKLNERDVNDFIIIVKFFEKHTLNVINNKLTFCDMIENIMIELSQIKEIEKSFFNYIAIYEQIELLLSKYLKGSEEWIRQLKCINENSQFVISLEKDKLSGITKYQLFGTYQNINFNKDENYFDNMINDYKHFSQDEFDSIFQKIFITKIPEYYNTYSENFITLYKNLKQLINVLNDLNFNGYHNKFEISIEIIESKISSIINKRNESLDLIIKNLCILNKKISEKLKELYEKLVYIRLFYPKQIIDIYNNIINTNENKTKIHAILNIYFNNSITKMQILNENNYIINEKDDFVKYCLIFEKINNFISEQLELNKITLKKIYEINKIKINEKPMHSKKKENNKNQKEKQITYKGIFFRKATNNNQDVEALNIYNYMTYNLPINACFFYCSKNASQEELKYFLLRSFLCEYSVLFCMINFYLLNNKSRRYFINIFKKYYTKYKKNMKSCLLLMFSDKDEELKDIILKFKNINSLPEYVANGRNFEFDSDYKVNLVNSIYCGLGKSFLINSEKNKESLNKKNKEKYNYIYFPIGGKFNINKFNERIDKFPDMSDITNKYVIHFDITQTKEIEFLNEFFFKLIILRKYDIFSTKHLGKNVEIIIEIPNDFINYIKEIKIFKYLKHETLSKITKINQSEDLLFVAKILTLYENNKILKPKEELNKEFSNLNLSSDKCESIILKYIKSDRLNNPNYYQINIFIKILSEEFQKFYNCEAYYSDNLLYNAKAVCSNIDDIHQVTNLRKFIITSLIKITNLFIISPYEKLIKDQELNLKIFEETDIEKEKLINRELEINIDSISFDNIHPSLIVFNEDGGSSTIIATSKKEEDEFKDLEKIYKTQTKDELKNFKELSGEEIFEKLLQFLNVSGYFSTKEKKNKILGTYVYTPDNFIKVILILMRIRVKIPIILMGETGCGKTKLIEMASQLINNGANKLHKLNIHAGINDEDIIDFIEKLNKKIEKEDKKLYEQKINEFENYSKEVKNLYLKGFSKKEIFSNYEKEIKNRKIWVFLDEINTCNSMGLITEIMCKNTLYGKPLDDRYVFIAACNPYRVYKKGNLLLNVLYKKNQKEKSLVYTVNPLPMSLMNFVFNFGSLKKDDESAYIKNMVERIVDKFFEGKKNDKDKNKLIKIETECVTLCQNFVKENNDVSIVSLREVNRFNIFFEFFINYFLERKHYKKNIQNDIEIREIYDFYSKKTDIEIFYFALNISLYICYYLRLPDKQSREKLSSLIDKNKYFSYDFLKIPKMELNFLIKNFTVPEGIAKNKSLKENLFLLFFCIINKIPLIICGKPGRSKTLSFKILQNSMKGPLSQNSFCQKYPELLSLKIQGSLNTTSKEIKNIFDRGRSYQILNPDKIWVIFMDEMGLAEISENNPLKVLHAELEQEENKISFVGISNWFIDSSKMNRVIYNVVQDPDEEDLIETGKEIAKSYEINGENICQKYENIIIRLSKAYYKFINKKKNNNDNNQYFHGSRDFYSLIKSVVNDIIINDKKLSEYEFDKKINSLNKICVKNIMRNFGGLENSINDFKQYFFEDFENIIYEKDYDLNYNVKLCLKENINDKNSRYLLLITENNLSQELLNYIFEEIYQDKNQENNEKKEITSKYYFGSAFKLDKTNISYSNEILKKIKYEMETGNILILKDLESVYPALYELFNQSYIYLDGKKFVYLGESQSLSLVNDNFKVIVLVNKKQIEEQEPPFLNRFEKHIINYSNLLNEDLLKLSNEIYSVLNEINLCIDEFINNESENHIFSKKNVRKKLEKFIGFIKEEEIKGLVYISSIKLKKENNNFREYKNSIIKFVLSKLVSFFSEELMILISKYGWKNKFMDYYDRIYQVYKENYNYNFRNYIENLIYEISIIYTYSSILEEFNNFNFIVENKHFGVSFSNSSIKQINISEITAKEQIEKEIIDFIFDNTNLGNEIEKNLLIFKFREVDLNKLNNIYYLLNDFKNALKENRARGQRKFVILIIYLQKDEKIKSSNSISFISNFPQKFIENLNNEYNNFPEILHSSNEKIIKNRLFQIEQIFINNMSDIFRYFDFNIVNSHKLISNNIPFSITLLNNAIKSEQIQNIFVECFLKIIKEEEDSIIKIFRNEICNKEKLSDVDFMKSFSEYFYKITFQNFRKIVIFLEKEQIMFSVIFNSELCQNEIIKKYIEAYISNIINEENKNFQWDDELVNKKYTINLLYERKLPFLEKIFNKIFSYIDKNISIAFLEEDTYFFYKNIQNEKIYERTEKYKKNLLKLSNNLYSEINKYGIIMDILKSNNEYLISSFFEDLFLIFINKNTKLKDHYSELSKVLDLIIQIRMKTRMKGKLNMDYLNENLEFTSFMDLIKNEIKEKNKNLVNAEKNLKEMKMNIENIYINNFLSIVIFLQSYSKEINIILEIYNFLLEHLPSLYEQMIELIKNKEIKMERSDKNKDINQINKAPFFYIIESICKIMNKKICLILKKQKDKDSNESDKYFSSVQLFINNLLKLETMFKLYSKEIYLLDIIIKIVEKIKLASKKSQNLETLVDYLAKIFSKIENKSNQILNLYFILTLIFEDKPEEFGFLMAKIILNIYDSDQKIRKDLLEKIIMNSSLQFSSYILDYSFSIFNRIFQFDSIKLLEHNFFHFFENPSDIKLLIENGIQQNNDLICDLFEYSFEIFFDNYFKKIEYENVKDSDKALKEYLIEATEFIYVKNEAKIKEFKLRKICQLFSIAYIKTYLKYLVDIFTNNEKYHHFIIRTEILQIIFYTDVKQKNCVIYYFLKLLWDKYRDWEKLKSFYNKNEEIKNYFQKIIELDEEKSLFCAPTLLVCNIQKENYDYNNLLLQNELNENNKEQFDELFLVKNDFDYLYTFLANIIIIYYSCHEHSKKKINCKNLLNSVLKYLNEQKILQNILNFINLFFNLDNFNSIKESLGIRNDEQVCSIEILKKKIIILYNGLRFIFSLIAYLNKNPDKDKVKSKGFYLNLISKNIISELDKNYIPGSFQNINTKIKTFYDIKGFLKISPKKYGAYICPCGQINSYEFSSYEMKCPTCNKVFNSTKNYVRIFFDDEIREEILSRKNIKKEYQNILLAEFEEEIEKEKNLLQKGLKPVEFDTLIRKEEKVRNMNDITFRIMNFILYSFIFYGNKIGYIDETNIKKYTIEKITIFQILESDWKFLESSLGKDSVETYLNLIYDKIVQKLIENHDFKNKENATKFEEDINEIINSLISDKNKVNLFKEKSKQILNINQNSSKVIIQEIFPFNKYDEIEFPNFRYFYLSELPSKDHFISLYDSMNGFNEKYPMLNKIIYDKEFKNKEKIMKNLPKINELCNFMINFISYKYSREEAKKKLIVKEIIDDKIELIKDFIKIYNEIRPYFNQQFGNKYLKMEFNQLKLADLCVDSSEEGYGSVLYTIYKEMIEWQNEFINSIINLGKQEIQIYKELFDMKIMIQDCEDDQIMELPKFDEYLNIDENKNEKMNQKYEINLLKIICDNSSRKEYKVKYNLPEIEKKLVSNILAKIKSFKNDIRTVVYKYECSIEDRSKIIMNFIQKYPQRELNETELKSLVCTILKNKKLDIKNILFSLNILIDIILEENIDINTSLYSVTKAAKSNAITDKIINFFDMLLENMTIRNEKSLTINCLINLIEILELFIWDTIKENLEQKYKVDIDDKIKDQFKSNNILIQDNIDDDKLELCIAIRRFITRYLSGKSGENIVKNNKKLKQNLSVCEFWPSKFSFIEDKLNKMFGNIEVNISQAYKLYEYLGGDENDKIKLNEIIIKNEEKELSEDEKEKEKEEEEENDDSDDDKRFENDDEAKNNSDDDEDDEHRQSDNEENEENNDNSVDY